MTPYERSRLNSIVSEMADGETRLNPIPGIASVTRKDRWESSYTWAVCSLHGVAHCCPTDRVESSC